MLADWLLLHGRVQHLHHECVQLLVAENTEETQMVDTFEAYWTECGQPEEQLSETTIVASVIRSTMFVQAGVDLFAAHVHILFALQRPNICGDENHIRH